MKKCFYLFVLFFVLFVPNKALSQVHTRALWISRWDFKSATDVVRIMENAITLGANTVYFQVRGNATVFYPSKIEPWAWELTEEKPHSVINPPGWNPLATAVLEAKKRKLNIQAWMNVFPGWRGIIPPNRKSNQIWLTKRSWFMVDHRGILLRPAKSFYAFLSPGHPEVRTYLADVFGEVAQNYPTLDGIHMDYVRYPGHKEVGRFRDFSYEKASINAFKDQFGKKPLYNLPEWQSFKCAQVTETIRGIRESILKSAPNMTLSTTCVADINHATAQTGQNPKIWLSQKLVDEIIPMVYKKNTNEVIELLDSFESFVGSEYKELLIPGLNVAFNSITESKRQIDKVYERNYKGQALFAYQALFPDHKPNKKAKVIESIWREQYIKEILSRSAN